ncbi:hypothetical protein DPEC_G00020820 [Dallia pectoralis]|uniref:Uncharacterized protein n=1 Tax=Dallia pectoralis TaxID=75939 RepID=A0ACC2HG24_DALPE|nr:hypothetical protein DPEC_G00020820 [Dallia pectoralis]
MKMWNRTHLIPQGNMGLKMLHRTQPALKLSDVNPPDIQKVIVEHIVRNEDSALQVHTSLRLRPFSGHFPKSNNEVDYETWRSNVELLLKDTTQSDLYKSRKLLESLLSPAIDIVKHLTPESPLNAYLEILDSAFSTVEDGDDLFAKYLNTMQDNGEKPSAYLQRLQVMLNTTLRRGGVTASDLDRHLLRQFVRGCWDNILIAELQLEQKKQNPPTFAELLLSLRIAEDKRTSKASRMKHHLNISKPRVSSYYQSTYVQSEEDCNPSQPALDHRAVIAEMHAVKSVQSVKTPDSDLPTKPDQKFDLNIDFTDSPVPNEWKERITEKLSSMPEVFAQHELDFGRTDKIKHHITLSDMTTFKHRPRPIHPQDIEAVRNHLQQLLDAEVIRESESPFSSPIVVVRKKNGDVRLCIDYRRLNTQTVKDSYALPNLEESFSALTGSKWFSVLDLKSGFYQIEMEEADKQKTAFVCPLGFFEFNRMPQGITNAPSTFQRLMERCMGELNLKQVLVFLDDLIIFSSTLEEHEERLMRVLNQLKEFGLKLSPGKCRFFQTSVKYLGHIVSEKGIETDPDKVAALKTWPKPNNLKEFRTFLGFCGYYRRFIKDYSKIVKPLNELTAGYPPLRKHTKTTVNSEKYYNPKDLFGDRWTSACQASFDTIIRKLTTAPILGFADPKLPYILHTDASTSGLGAALYQEQQGQKRVVAYASRGLSKCESRYPAHKLEFLALKWAVTEKFQDYLYGNMFFAVTDSNPLTYILTSAKLDATNYRWLAALSTFDFQLQYRAGKQNQDADGLSRRPHVRLPDDTSSQKELERIQQFTKRHLSVADYAHLDEDTIKAICEKHLVREVINNHSGETSPSNTLVLSLAHHPKALPQSFEEEDQLGGLPVIPSLGPAEIRDKQNADPCIREVLRQVELEEKPPPSLRKELPELGLLLREWNKLTVLGGVLYRKRKEDAQTHYQLVLPEALRSLVLKSLHDDMGHMGAERTLDLIRKRFYWPKMSAEVETKVKTCNRCIRRKTMPEKAAPLVNIIATRPLELVCMDFLSVEPDSSNTKDILVITDHFTKYAVAVPTPNQKARTVAKSLWDHFFVHYGIPEKLHSDQGPDFESRTIKELCELIGTQKIRTTPYHPRGNPVERFNRTLLNMLGTLENQKKSHWRDYVKPLVHAYNCTKNETTGFTPYELMFGRQPRLPVDLAFGLPVNHQSGSHSQYVRNLKSQLENSYKVATENAKKTASRNKTRFDKHVVDSTLKEGDRVLVRNVRLRGKHKLADRWESDVYVVQRQSGDVPVYVVKPETRDGPQRTLHRDLLLPCGFLPMTSTESKTNPSKAVRRPRTRQHPKNDGSDGADGDESQSDSEEYHYDGHRNLRVETLDFDPTPEPIEHLPERIELEPSKELTAAKQDVAKAFPEDVPVETCDLNLPDPADCDLPDPADCDLPDPADCDLSDPEESSSAAGQETGNLPEEDLDNVHPSTQPPQEGKENTSVVDQTDIQTEVLQRRHRSSILSLSFLLHTEQTRAT